MKKVLTLKSEPPFKPKPGQIDYTHAKRAPVVNCVVKCGEKILLLHRSKELRFYPDYWHCVGGFLDDGKPPIEKAREELREELGIEAGDIVSMREGQAFERKDALYGKTWVIHPVLAEVKSDKVRLDWEAEEYRWVLPSEVKKFKLVEGFERVLEILLGFAAP